MAFDQRPILIEYAACNWLAESGVGQIDLGNVMMDGTYICNDRGIRRKGNFIYADAQATSSL